jgi:uncharacterized membrane protein
MKPGMSNEASFWAWILGICIVAWFVLLAGAAVGLWWAER